MAIKNPLMMSIYYGAYNIELNRLLYENLKHFSFQKYYYIYLK